MLYSPVPDPPHRAAAGAQNPAQSAVAAFLKYHVLRLGTDYYLTTNPTLKHLYCRHGPGVYIATDALLARLSVSVYDDEARSLRLVATIDKQSNGHGGGFLVSQSDGSCDASYAMLPVSRRTSGLPPPYSHTTDHKVFGRNNDVWRVGLIPHVKERSLSKVKHKLLRSESTLPVKTKLCNANHVYLHRCQLGEEPLHITHMYQLLPQVGAFFRPCQYSVKTRLSHTALALTRSLRHARYLPHLHRTEPPDSIGDMGAGVNVRSFLAAETGFCQSRTADDCPNHEKVGWITVFDHCHKEGFDLPVVLALVLAVALDGSSSRDFDFG